jgi:UDP-2-acetamido-2-deoxy-ribo-hexuluronate aminotransferase
MQHSSIQMVDLKSQYQRIKGEIDVAIQGVIENAQFIKGPSVKEFETNLSNFLNVKHLISCANGTDALQIAMMALGLKPGDEVIVPVFTYIATAEVIGLLGLIPVMVDVDADTFCIDVNQIEVVITERTKAIVPVHLFGQCANMDAIMATAKKNNLFVIEDTAQAIGAVYTFQDGSTKSAGCIGDIGTTSFFPSKNLGCFGDGGALFTNNDELAEKLRMICNHGQKVQYVHDIIGVNSRLDTIQAAILNVKLKYLRQYEENRRQAADWYDEALNDVNWLQTPKRVVNSTHVFHQYTLKIIGGRKVREMVKNQLNEKGIPTMIYYPIPLHMQKAFSSDCYGIDSFKVSESLCASVLSLPIHTEMSQKQVLWICFCITEIGNSISLP